MPPSSRSTPQLGNKALQRLLARDAASVVSPPSIDENEVEILTTEQINVVIDKLVDHPLYEITAVGLATGLRRVELLALSSRMLTGIEHSCPSGYRSRKPRRLLRFKEPKTNRASA